MSYEQEESETFFHFSDKEDAFITKFLKEKGYSISQNTVCGNCCGMFADKYWVNGIGGNFKKEDKEELYKLMKKKGYECSIGGYTISADPDDKEEYQVKIN